ncbi:thiol:disulfide interchange protein [Candidatus Photodesmus blepharus]|uniref:Thiol:disulfide interchange protein n=1 Tax=Candidatus Photodesmus blepharonis TaxID=1179155 RepID=A0A084CMX8_9GAMM|nr:DsbE family thiol:disulfide interchange protein [Candidatus Photodesmus blepharus]KEY91157.1 thiol:disulfide interchange protein [Candidatus Photodesmus blepharus]
MKQKIVFIPLAIFVFLIVVLFIQLYQNLDGDHPSKLESVLIGKTIPEFTLEDLEESGKFYDKTIFNGKPLLLHVWATWCPACYAEHQYLNELAKKKVRIVGLNYRDERVKAIRWLNELGNPYFVSLFDKYGTLSLDLGVYGAPEMFLIDRNGIIRYRHVGEINLHSWNTVLMPMYNSLLREVGL